MARGRVAKLLVERVDLRGGVPEVHRQPDELIVEEPLEIHLDGHLVTTTMRTPGDDFELAAGLCFTDGLLAGAAVTRCRYCGECGSAMETAFNVVTVETGGRAPIPVARVATTTSSCGLCGSASIEALQQRLSPLCGLAEISLEVLAAAPGWARQEQGLFDATGAVHAAAAFTADGETLVVREDIGRHNAVDKVVGRLLFDERLPAHDLGLYVSGRASFEIVQKAWAAGFAAIVAVSAPSSLAVETARAAGLMLAGFVRDGHMNVYS
ncbi:MAG: FdhD protein [Acidimicrobiaceae bacterium]|jgi:FdhD protein